MNDEVDWMGLLARYVNHIAEAVGGDMLHFESEDVLGLTDEQIALIEQARREFTARFVLPHQVRMLDQAP